MSFWRYFTISHVHSFPSLHIYIPDDYISTEIVSHSSDQLMANANKETSKLRYDKQPAPLCPDVMWPVQKVSDLQPGKIHLHCWRSATLIPFEVVSLWLNTLLPVVQPSFKAFLECLFVNEVQLGHCVPNNIVVWLKSSPFQLHFQVGEQPKIARSHVGRVGSLLNHRNVVFGQESLNQLRGMSWCIVIMQLPRSHCPQVRPLVPHSIAKATKDFQVVFFVNVLALWCVLVMHHPMGTKENGQHHFDVAVHLHGLFWPQGC